jgi:tetratricopeptide (TPR) repeat protein
MNKLFKKMEIFKVKSMPIYPTSLGEPTTADDFQKRGMAYYARKQYAQAEVDLKKAISLDSNHLDSYYSLGMVYKATDRKEEAVDAFTHVIDLIQANPGVETTKNDMLRKLALGHMNEINQGDWNLEKEIWKHID